MPGSYGDFAGHRDMAAYLDAYADAFGLREVIGFGVTVERLEPDLDGSWRVALDDGSVHRFRAVVVATGHDWCPRLPEEPDGFAGEVSHAHDYRTPRGSRVAACWWSAPASRRPRSPWRSRGWRRAPSSPCGPAPTWSRAGSAGGPTTPPTSSRSTGCRGRC
jgi:cation diffusion facilitator CzcD-associated flavoprotein CzcO